MQIPHTVIIDGVVYAPQVTTNTTDTANALLRMVIGGWYMSLYCEVDGDAIKKHCNCGKCRAVRMISQFLGNPPEQINDETEPGFVALYEANKRN